MCSTYKIELSRSMKSPPLDRTSQLARLLPSASLTIRHQSSWFSVVATRLWISTDFIPHFQAGIATWDVSTSLPSTASHIVTQVFQVEQGDILVRSMDSYIFALDSDLVLGAAGCIPFNHEYSLIPGISDLRYDSATLSWIFSFLRREEVEPIEDLLFSQLIGIASAASEFGFHSIQTLCRLALRCAQCL